MQVKKLDDIYKYFPTNIYSILRNVTEQNSQIERELQEIRIRAVSQTEILQIIEKLCNNSIYAYKNQICEGFITIKGGHRVRNNRKCSYRK